MLLACPGSPLGQLLRGTVPSKTCLCRLLAMPSLCPTSHRVPGGPVLSSPASRGRLWRDVSEFLALRASYLCCLSSRARERVSFHFPCISTLSLIALPAPAAKAHV